MAFLTREQKIEKARELRERDWTYAQIGIRLGVTGSCVHGWLKPEWLAEKRRRSNAKRHEAKRQWERDNRAACPQCGAPMGQGSRCPSARPELCRDCVQENARRKQLQYIDLREEGLTNREIEERLGLPFNTVANALAKARRDGLRVAPSPYWNRTQSKVAA